MDKNHVLEMKGFWRNPKVAFNRPDRLLNPCQSALTMPNQVSLSPQISSTPPILFISLFSDIFNHLILYAQDLRQKKELRCSSSAVKQT
jgi:hypothetical protein